MAKTILVLPDSHALPGTSLERFTWLGKLIHDLKPDVFVCLGDLFDFESLCFHSKKVEIEGKRYAEDVSAGIEAQDRIFHELRKHKKRMPEAIFCLGNHDIRPERYVADNPIFQDKISLRDLELQNYPWEVYPFLEAAEVQGIDFMHYATSGIMGRPIGGMHPAYTTIKKRNKSTVTGHSHVYDFKTDITPGNSLMGLVGGCFLEDKMGYAGPANYMWSSGVSLLHDAEKGLWDQEWISIERLKKAYG